MTRSNEVNPEEPERGLVSRRKFLGGVAGAGIGGLRCRHSGRVRLGRRGRRGTCRRGTGVDDGARSDGSEHGPADRDRLARPTISSRGRRPGDVRQGSDLAIAEINDSGGVAGR